MKNLKNDYLIIISIMLSLMLISCEKERIDPLPLTPDEWWDSLSPEWRDCILNSSMTLDSTGHFEPKLILEKVYYVNCNGHNFQNLDPLKYMSNLTGLSCIDSSLTNIQALLYLYKLEDVNLSGTKISDLTSLKNSKNLRELYFNETNINDISILSKLSKIELLQFERTKVENINSLKELKNLREIIFDFTSVSTIKPIMELDSIQYLNCCWTNVPEIEINEFKQKHPNCLVQY